MHPERGRGAGGGEKEREKVREREKERKKEGMRERMRERERERARESARERGVCPEFRKCSMKALFVIPQCRVQEINNTTEAGNIINFDNSI